jgi:hypothetical protein
LSFCRRARDLGYKIWAEPFVKLGHIGHEIIWPDTYWQYQKSLER